MRRTLSYRLVDGIGRTFHRRGLVKLGLDPDELCAEAQRRVGLNDFGEDDFRRPLQMLVRCLGEEATLTFVGRLFAREVLIQKLINRLLLTDSLRRHPEILEVDIRAPIFITGLPRTGTTLLHRLMAQDPSLRHLQMWEVWQPAPPPDPDTYRADPRRSKRAYNNSDAPGMLGRLCALEDWLIGRETVQKRQAAHWVEMSEPEECQLLFMNSFLSQEFVLFFADAIPSYIMWLLDQELTAAYMYYRRQLQLLTWKFPNQRLLLKSPMHLQGMDALFRVFPDATVLWTHRDPRSVVPSWCSLNRIDGEIYNDACPDGVRRLGQTVLEWLGREMDRALRLLPGLPSERIVHLSYRALVAATVPFVLDLRGRLGLRADQATEERMRNWMSHDGKQSRGVHRYQAGSFGLDDEVVDERFSSYRRAFAGQL
ncbi:MAG: sulfotransferase [Chloroflexi bacterium]|nr:MAG: sulfotransferase [Chloroflexota bacterium]